MQRCLHCHLQPPLVARSAFANAIVLLVDRIRIIVDRTIVAIFACLSALCGTPSGFATLWR
jgi:hypothetical protein